MSSSDTTIWVSAYLFYPGSWEDCLIHAVCPFVQQGRQRGVINQFFFIRYWEGGPHIRLRLKCSVAHQGRLKEEVQGYFCRYFRSIQSTPPEPMVAQANVSQVTFVDYVPETDRYGGHAFMPVAEQQFELSSDTVLNFIADKQGWNYQRAMGVAIQMHLSFAFACQMCLVEAIAFFQYVSKVSDYIDPVHEIAVRRAFEKSFDEQRSYLVPYCRQLWETLNDGESAGDGRMDAWIAGVANMHQHCGAMGQPVAHALYVPEAHPMYFRVYASFVHMNNNRLGILNRDEGYLAYLLVHCLTEIQVV